MLGRMLRMEEELEVIFTIVLFLSVMDKIVGNIEKDMDIVTTSDTVFAWTTIS